MKYRIVKEVNSINRLERYKVQYKTLFGWADAYKNSYGEMKAVFYDKDEAREYIENEQSKKAWSQSEIINY